MSLLNLALSIQKKQTVSYYKFAGQTENDIGEDVPSYEEAINLVGSFQPISQDLYAQNGFDLKKKYFVFYTSNNVFGVDRDTSGDKIIYNNDTFQALHKDNWFAYDGFVGVTIVKQ